MQISCPSSGSELFAPTHLSWRSVLWCKKVGSREEHFNPYGAANSTCHWSQPQNIKYTPYWKQLARPPQREFTKNEMVASRNATPFGLPGLPKRVSNTDIGVRLVRSTALVQSPELEWRDCRLTAQLMSSSVQISHVWFRNLSFYKSRNQMFFDFFFIFRFRNNHKRCLTERNLYHQILIFVKIRRYQYHQKMM